MAYLLDDSWDNCTPVARAGNAAFGVYVRCGIWAARNLTDGFVPSEVVSAYGAPELARKLVDVGLWETAEGGYRAADYLDRNPTAVAVQARRVQQAKRNALGRDPALRHAIRSRDLDRCRYCGVAVNWTDRKGPRGGTYDHIDPAGPNSYENLAVACRSCNSAKGDRLPHEAGMELLPPPGVPGGNQIGSKSESDSNLGSLRSNTPPKGGKGRAPTSATPPAVSPPAQCRGFTDDGNGWCRSCHLPKANKIHFRRAS